MRLMIAGLALGAAVAACAPMSEPPAGAPAAKRCDAQASRALIGSHRGAVDFAPGTNVRFVCTTCMATQDYDPTRLNVRFEEATGIIRSVDCG